ncbi:Phosphatidylinositol-4-phosphate 5-kinase core [Trinorchestia longiramus]|nr:Phosphatidylinositol-4-phosphate 5-kinase core [Trinorchestia longiramus]
MQSSHETGLAEFGVMPTEQPQTYGSTILGYFRRITGGLNKSSSASNVASASSVESAEGASEQDASGSLEADHSQESAGVGPSLAEFPTERSLYATLKRIEYVLRVKGQGIEDARGHWASDSSTSSCHKCDDRFSTFKRRHHCRLCGDLFCSACCNIRLPHDLVLRAAEPVRVCECCHRTTIQYHMAENEYSWGVSQGLSSSPSFTSYVCGMPTCLNPGDSNSSHVWPRDVTPIGGEADLFARQRLNRTGLSVAAPRSGRLAMGFLEENYAGRARQWSAEDGVLSASADGAGSDDDTEDLSHFLSYEQLQAIHHRAVNGPRRLMGTAHRYRTKTHHSCFLPSDLINWILSSNFAADRPEAVGICKALLRRRFISCVVSPHPGCDHFVDTSVPYRLATALPVNQNTTLGGDGSVSVGASPAVSLVGVRRSSFGPMQGASIFGSALMATVSYSKFSDRVETNSSTPRRRGIIISEKNESDSSPTTEASPQRSKAAVPDADPLTLPSVMVISRGRSSTLVDEAHSTSERSRSDDLNYSTIIPDMAPTDSACESTDGLTPSKLSNADTGFCPDTQQPMRHPLNDQALDKIHYRLDRCWEAQVQQVLQVVLQWCSVPSSWTPVLWPLIQRVAYTVAPDVRNAMDEMDIRRYVRFKKLPGGSPSECSVEHGVVCTKTVADRSMSTRLSDPHILLLADAPDLYPAFDYEPIASSRAKESENVRSVVMRIASCKPRPHVVLLEGSLTLSCLEKLQANGVTVVPCVKRRVLEAVARVTQAELVTDLTTRSTAPVLGLCHTFDCRTYELSSTTKTDLDRLRESKKSYLFQNYCDDDKENINSNLPAPTSVPLPHAAPSTIKKHLMFFTGCPAHLGCTVLLRGGTLPQLRCVKNAFKFMVYVLYNWKFEKSYLVQEKALVSTQFLNDVINLDSSEDTPVGFNKADAQELNEFKNNGNQDKERPRVDVKTSVIKSQSSVPSSPNRIGKIINDCSDPLRSDIVPQQTSKSMSVMVVDDVSYDDLEKNAFKKALNEVIICTSPYIRKPMPFWETEAGQVSPLRKFFPKVLYYSVYLDKIKRKRKQAGFLHNGSQNQSKLTPMSSNVSTLQKSNKVMVEIKEQHPFVADRIWGKVPKTVRALAYADFRASGGQLYVSPQSCHQKDEFTFVNEDDLYTEEDEDLCLKPWKWEVLDGSKLKDTSQAPQNEKKDTLPGEDEEGADWGERGPCNEVEALHLSNHQHIAVLFSCKGLYSSNCSYCVEPCELVMEFYGLNDSPLGAFLESYYFTDYKCPGSVARGKYGKSTEKCSAELHVRRFYHNSCAVQITSRRVAPKEGMEDKQAIWLWNWCDLCKKSGPTVLMSPVTWSFSLAKFLEIWFYGGGVATAAPHNYEKTRYSDMAGPGASDITSSDQVRSGGGGVDEAGTEPETSTSTRPISSATNVETRVTLDLQTNAGNCGPNTTVSSPNGSISSQKPSVEDTTTVNPTATSSGSCRGDVNGKDSAVANYSSCRASDSSKIGSSGLFNSDCPHALHRPHHRQFFYNNGRLVVVSLEVVPVRNMMLPATPLPLFVTPITKQEAVEQLKRVTDEGYSVFETMRSNMPAVQDSGLRRAVSWHRTRFKALIENIQLQLTSHKMESVETANSTENFADGDECETHITHEVLPNDDPMITGLSSSVPCASKNSSLSRVPVERSIDKNAHLRNLTTNTGDKFVAGSIPNPVESSSGSSNVEQSTEIIAAFEHGTISSSVGEESCDSLSLNKLDHVSVDSPSSTSITTSQILSVPVSVITCSNISSSHSLSSVQAATAASDEPLASDDKTSLNSEHSTRPPNTVGGFIRDDTSASGAVPESTLFCVQDKIVLLHRIIVEALTMWNTWYEGKKEDNSFENNEASIRGVASSDNRSEVGVKRLATCHSSSDHFSSDAEKQACDASLLAKTKQPVKPLDPGVAKSIPDQETWHHNYPAFILENIAAIEAKLEKNEARKRALSHVFNSAWESLLEHEYGSTNGNGKNSREEYSQDSNKASELGEHGSISTNENLVTSSLKDTSDGSLNVTSDTPKSLETLPNDDSGDGIMNVGADHTVGLADETPVDLAKEASETMQVSPQQSPRVRTLSGRASAALPPAGTAGASDPGRSRFFNLRSSSPHTDLKCPFPGERHYKGLEELLVPVVVDHTQESSIIAHALSSISYHQQLLRYLTLLHWQHTRSGSTGSCSSNDVQQHRNRATSTHISVSWHDHGSFTCKLFFSAEFHLLRRVLLPQEGEEAFVRSLSGSQGWATRGGKSKSAFHKTRDDRFVLKELKSAEQEGIEEFFPAYFKHITSTQEHNKPSALARIFGIYSVSYSKNSRSSKNTASSTSSSVGGAPDVSGARPLSGAPGKVYMVMENLFYGHDIAKIYDLKGNTSNRLVKEEPNASPGEVFLDCNLRRHRVEEELLLVSPRTASVLPRAIEADCSFLRNCHIMDYSLLVGVTRHPHQHSGLVVGIIDYIRKFTRDKYLENVLKENVMRTEDPTIVSPEQYFKRFSCTIPRYFDKVPDSWSGLDVIDLQRSLEAEEEQAL